MKSFLFAFLFVLVAVKHTSATCQKEDGFTYILGECAPGVPGCQPGSPFYKVGGSVRAGDVRATELQIGNPRPLYVTAEWSVYDCYNSEEDARKAAYRTSTPMGHEWFYVTNYNQFYNAIAAAVSQYEDKTENQLAKLMEILLSKQSTST